jgi:nucleotide-binding universal stress UspA family protein
MKESNPECLEQKSPIACKSILVPLDLSEQSIEAIRTAASLAEQCGAKIMLLHVVELPIAYSFETGAAADEAMNVARESLDKIAAEIPATLISEKLVCFSDQGTVQKIVETACSVSSDLIILATHHHSPFRRALFGSTTEHVIRHAPCAVLVVPHRQDCERDQAHSRFALAQGKRMSECQENAAA